MTGLLQYVLSGFVPFVGTLFLVFFVTCMVCIILSVLVGGDKERTYTFKIPAMQEMFDDLINVLKKILEKDKLR